MPQPGLNSTCSEHQPQCRCLGTPPLCTHELNQRSLEFPASPPSDADMSLLKGFSFIEGNVFCQRAEGDRTDQAPCPISWTHSGLQLF